jgi:hypothetical protein
VRTSNPTYVFQFTLTITHHVEESFFCFVLKATTVITVLVQQFGLRGSEFDYLTMLLNSRDRTKKLQLWTMSEINVKPTDGQLYFQHKINLKILTTKREERRLKAFENRVLRKILQTKKEKVIGGYRKLHNE